MSKQDVLDQISNLIGDREIRSLSTSERDNQLLATIEFIQPVTVYYQQATVNDRATIEAAGLVPVDYQVTPDYKIHLVDDTTTEELDDYMVRDRVRTLLVVPGNLQRRLAGKIVGSDRVYATLGDALQRILEEVS